MRIGLSYDLRQSMTAGPGGPDDALEEYDSVDTVEIIAHALEAGGNTVVRLEGGARFLDGIRREQVDIVFNIAEGRGSYRSREAQVPAVLEMLDIPYTGSDPGCLALCLDKPVTKKLVMADGVNTPQWLAVSTGEELRQADWSSLTFPAIVKPSFEGSSKGIRLTSLVPDADAGRREAERVLDIYRQPVMIEEFIDGDEITVGMVGNTPPKIVGMMRVVPRRKERHFVYSVEVKRDYLNLVDYECPADLAPAVLDRIAESSQKVFRTLGCRDFARIDFRVAADGTVHFLEINPLPGLGTYSDLVIMALKMGWTHEALIRAVLEAALQRYPQCVRA